VLSLDTLRALQSGARPSESTAGSVLERLVVAYCLGDVCETLGSRERWKRGAFGVGTCDELG
jgi:hypothetical protein